MPGILPMVPEFDGLSRSSLFLCFTGSSVLPASHRLYTVRRLLSRDENFEVAWHRSAVFI